MPYKDLPAQVRMELVVCLESFLKVYAFIASYALCTNPSTESYCGMEFYILMKAKLIISTSQLNPLCNNKLMFYVLLLLIKIYNDVMKKSCEQRLITKEDKATPTHFKFRFFTPVPW